MAYGQLFDGYALQLRPETRFHSLSGVSVELSGQTRRSGFFHFGECMCVRACMCVSAFSTRLPRTSFMTTGPRRR